MGNGVVLLCGVSFIYVHFPARRLFYVLLLYFGSPAICVHLYVHLLCVLLFRFFFFFFFVITFYSFFCSVFFPIIFSLLLESSLSFTLLRIQKNILLAQHNIVLDIHKYKIFGFFSSFWRSFGCCCFLFSCIHRLGGIIFSFMWIFVVVVSLFLFAHFFLFSLL